MLKLITDHTEMEALDPDGLWDDVQCVITGTRAEVRANVVVEVTKRVIVTLPSGNKNVVDTYVVDRVTRFEEDEAVDQIVSVSGSFGDLFSETKDKYELGIYFKS